MKVLLSLAVAASAMLTVPTAADAREGCGRGAHRGPYGHCRPNVRGYYGGPGIGRPYFGPPRSGYFYQGRGWYDGNRYWGHRYRDGRGWRYR